MTIRKQLIEHACPICNAEYGFLPEKAGQEAACNRCNTSFIIPEGLPMRMVSVSTDPGRPLTAEETAEFYNSPAGRAYLASQMPSTGGALARRTVQADLIPQAYPGTPEPRYPVPRHDDDKKVKLGFGKWGGMEVDVDGKTRNAMATTFLGGLLVAIGAVVMAKLGLKSKA